MSIDINEILDQAFELEGVDRDAYLEVACAGDTLLRENVDQLLVGLDQSAPPEFMEGPIPMPDIDLGNLEDFLDFPAINSSHIKPGQRIDAYKIVERLGQGGMGEVYLAERDDGEFKQKVAIKVVRSGMATEEVYKRFQYERQILANLSHPNIARLLFGGVTTDGLPYFVMEYVEEGTPITEYCDTHQLSIKERLELFKVVCDAVRYAQRNLVVHRDLKPSNILVNEDGEVKLLDFGIAKLLDSDMDPVTMFETTHHKAPFTPAYAAPEQVRGKTVSAATDVYSLGMILYQILTGRRAYELEPGWLKPKNVELICDFIPTLPSSIVTQRFINEQTGVQHTHSTLRQLDPIRLKRTLHGDLDAIVMKAIKKEPENRYGAAGELYEEIERYLDNRPVLAQNDSFRYRTWKFVQRKRSLVLASSIAILALVAGLVTVLIQNQIIKTESQKALARSEFLLGVFAELNPDVRQGKELSEYDILEVGLRDIEDLDAVLKENVYSTAGEAALNMGAYPKAETLFTSAIQIGEKELGHSSYSVLRNQYLLALAYRNRAQFNTSADILKGIVGKVNTRGVDNKLLKTQILNALSLISRDTQNVEESVKWARQSVDIIGQINPSRLDPSQLEELQRVHAEALDRLGYGLVSLEKTCNNEALSSLQQSLLIRKSLFGEEHPKVANTLYILGDCFSANSDWKQAYDNHRNAYSIFTASYGEKHINTATSLYATGKALYWKGGASIDSVDTYLANAASILEEQFGKNHLYNANVLSWRGVFLVESGNIQKGRSILEDVVTIYSLDNTIKDDQKYKVRAEFWLAKALAQEEPSDSRIKEFFLDSFQFSSALPEEEEMFIKEASKAYLVENYTLSQTERALLMH